MALQTHEVAQEHGLIFSGEKCAVKHNSVKFFRCVYAKDGVHPDPAKVSTMKEMPVLQSPTDLQSFLGMVTYLAPFIPSLSTTGTTHKMWNTLGVQPTKKHLTTSCPWYALTPHHSDTLI